VHIKTNVGENDLLVPLVPCWLMFAGIKPRL